MAMPLIDPLDTDVIFFLRCPVLVEGRELPVDLVLLDVIDFDVILRMDCLSMHYATLDFRSKVVIFRIPGEEEFKFLGDKSSTPQNLISTITERKMLKKGCQSYLVVVRDTKVDKRAVENVPIVCEFPNILLEELPSLPPERC